jgi:hypothetical protein
MEYLCDKPITLRSQKTVDFYNAYPAIDPEKVNAFVIDMLQNCLNSKHSLTDTICVPSKTSHSTSISDEFMCAPYKDTYNNNILDGVHGENKLENILNKLNPTMEVVKNTDDTIHGDFIIKNAARPDVIIENKIVDMNVSNIAVNCFIETCKLQKANGVFISQHSGIIGKKNLEVDFVGRNIIVYISNVDYNEDKIQIALDVIDKLFDKIKMINVDNNVTISNDVLNEIKQEYQSFTRNKEDLHNYIKNTHSQIINKIGNINLVNTGDFLSTKFTQVDIPKKHTCDLCKMYTSNTLKGIAAHKRGCKKKTHI